MKKIPFILLLVAMMLSLTSWKMESASLHPSPLTIHPSPLPSDTTKTTPAKRDTSVAFTDTLEEMSVQAKKGLAVEDAIKKSLNNGLTQPRQKSVSDIIGSKATDYIMHPFAWKERKKEKKHNKDKENLKKYDAITSYEDELTNAINRQLQEDSIAAAKKKEGEKK
jgi:hypothetical protein